MPRRKGVMLAYPFSETRLNKWFESGLPVLAQPKINGVRCRAVPYLDGSYRLVSSEGHEIKSVPHINKALKGRFGVEFDGELFAPGIPFPYITSITSRTVNLHPLHETIEYHIFDIIDNRAQVERIGHLIEVSRKKRLDALQSIRFVTTNVVFRLTQIKKSLSLFSIQGYEGIILRHPTAPYIPKKTTTMMKMKPRKEGTYLIVNQHEEYSIHGEPKNRLGAFVCQTKEGKTFKVGTGLTTKQREEYWERSLEGKILRIKYQELTPRGVPFFPVFVEILNDADD